LEAFAAPAVTALALAEKTLRALEIKVAKPRASAGSVFTETTVVTLDLPDAFDQQETRKWLKETFTQEDNVVADSNYEMQMSPARTTLGRRGSFVQQAAAVNKALHMPAVSACLEKCGDYEFDALALAKALSKEEDQPLCIFGTHVLQYRGDVIASLKKRGWINDKTEFSQSLLSFIGKVNDSYLSSNPYHNAAHAVDVMATTDFLMRSAFVKERTTSFDHFLALVAAAVHDVGHPGTNALFQMKTMSPLAVRYNDQSILENMHCATAFQIMKESSECNWLSSLVDVADAQHASGLRQYARKGIISMVLGTDMAKHQKCVEQLSAFVAEERVGGNLVEGEVETSADKQRALERKLFLLDTVVHMADLSNPCKPRGIAVNWSKRVCEEFWMQGDLERTLGLQISPLCDRVVGMQGMPKSQIGFIDFVVTPLVGPLAEVSPEAKVLLDGLRKNGTFWEEMDKQGKTFEELFGDTASKL